MSFLEREIAKNLIESIKGKEKPKPYDTTAEVVRIEDGVAWVHIPGGVAETPTELSISAKEGDKVKVRVTGGSAWITGNSTSPPADDKKANLIIKEKIPKIYKEIKFVQKLLDKYAAHIDIGIDDNGNPFISLYSEINKNKVNITTKGIVVEANSGVVSIDSVGLASQTLNTQVLNLPNWQILGSDELKFFVK